ncbi:hypothetical protein FRB99_001760 [Tulasnella sp. 403]|nr:hypothetical protein FRB99_001760 [Tulasnella sp. 403]
MSLRPPSTSPSPSPGPHNSNPRSSLQPQPRGTAAAAGLAPISTRSNFTPGARPTSELLGVGSATFQTPEAEAIDQWFENLQNYEATLEEMAAASLDVNFKEELSAIEQWFRVLSEAERTAALYSLLQHSTQVQIRFFITVLQQMSRADPMTALLSPAVGSSMQSQMEAKLASMGLKSPALPPSPSVRSFGAGTPPVGSSGSRQSVSNIETSIYLSPDSAQNSQSTSTAGSGNAGADAAATLAQQRAKLKANASHRVSAPGPLVSEANVRPNSMWTQSSLSQVAERAPSPASGDLSPTPSSNARPKSTDFTGLANQFARSPRANSTTVGSDSASDLDLQMQELRLNEQLSPMVGGNWASMVNTPLVPMFTEGSAVGGNASQNNALDAAAAKLSTWSMGNGASGRVVLDDAKKFRRHSKGTGPPSGPNVGGNTISLNGSQQKSLPSAKEDNNSLMPPSSQNQKPNPRGAGWGNGSRSPASSNVSSNRFGGSDSGFGSDAGSSTFGGLGSGSISPGMGLGMGMGGFAGVYNGMNLGVPNMGALGGMGMPANNALEAQILAAQLGGGFSPSMGGSFQGTPTRMGMSMGNFGMGMGQMGMGMGVRGQPGGPGTAGTSPRGTTAGWRGGTRSPGQRGGAGGRSMVKGRSTTRQVRQLKEEEITPTLLADIDAWMRALRLHKYTPILVGKNWRDLVLMDDAALERLGISALGARRKLLKHFIVVREKFNIPHPAGSMDNAEDDEDEDDEDGEHKGGAAYAEEVELTENLGDDGDDEVHHVRSRGH